MRLEGTIGASALVPRHKSLQRASLVRAASARTARMHKVREPRQPPTRH
jgi:hypothetical protein